MTGDNRAGEAGKRKAEQVIAALARRNMKGYYCRNREEAREKILSLIAPGETVAWGGSVTLDRIGIKSYLPNGLDGLCQPREKALEVRKRSFFTDIYLTGTNAVTMEGELINIDKTGNRVAAMCFGPRKVIVVAGMNKLAENEEAALARIHMEACSANGIRMDKGTPCARTGRCGHCLISGETMCSFTVVTRFSSAEDRVHVILIEEALGY